MKYTGAAAINVVEITMPRKTVNKDAQSSATRFIKNFREAPRFMVKNDFRPFGDKIVQKKREGDKIHIYSETTFETSTILTRCWFSIIIAKTATEHRSRTGEQVRRFISLLFPAET